MKDKKPLIIFDTDMDTDCDDAGALALLYEYVKRGHVELLGIITDSVSPYAAACCEALGEYYNIQRPIGAVSSKAYPKSETDRCVRYREHNAKSSFYNQTISKKIGKTDCDYPSEVYMYRKLLADAPDNSVTILCVGLLTALSNLLLSEADNLSGLTGAELFQKKVYRVISMGYPAKAGNNFNWDMDGEGAETFFNLCPVSVYVSPVGGDIITGKTLGKCFPKEHPVRRIYELFTGGENRGRSSWDLIAALFAVESDTNMLTAVKRGMCRFDNAASRSYWQEDGARKDYEIIMNTTDEELTSYLEMRMTGNF